MLKKIYKEIKKFNTIVIARHIGADPDALASQLGLRESIIKTFPDKKVLALGASSPRFNYFPKLDKLETVSDALLIVVDTPDKKRVDLQDQNEFKYSIKIDHHPYIETFCDLEYIDDRASSASELVYRLITETNLEIDHDIARTLFLGIVGDTNRFLYNTTADTFKIIVKMLEKYDLDISSLYANIYMRPLNEVRLQGYISENMNVTENGLAYIKISEEKIKEFGVESGSAGNLVNNFSFIEEVITWVMISEDTKNDIIRINIRSRGPVINKVAEKYNGGGHKMASGARVKTMEDVDKLLKDLDEKCAKYLKDKGDLNENQ